MKPAPGKYRLKGALGLSWDVNIDATGMDSFPSLRWDWVDPPGSFVSPHGWSITFDSASTGAAVTPGGTPVAFTYSRL